MGVDAGKREDDNRPKESLLLAAVRMRKDQPEATEEDKQLEEEADILKHVLQKQALRAVKELAQVEPLGRRLTKHWYHIRIADANATRMVSHGQV